MARSYRPERVLSERAMPAKDNLSFYGSGFFQVEFGFQVVEGREVVGFAAEQVDDFHRRAKGGERIDLEDVE